MNTRLDNRITQPDRLVQALAVVAAALYLAFAGWLIAAEVSDGGASHVPTVRIDNQTHLTLEVELVDQHGARLTLGAHQPGLSSRSEVVDLGPSWTFQTSYGGRQVDGRPSTAPRWPARAGPSTSPPRPPPTWNAPATSRPTRSRAARHRPGPPAAPGGHHDRAALPGHPRPAPPRPTHRGRAVRAGAAPTNRPPALHGDHRTRQHRLGRANPAPVSQRPRRPMRPPCLSRPHQDDPRGWRWSLMVAADQARPPRVGR
jgi:hypothetical protein